MHKRRPIVGWRLAMVDGSGSPEKPFRKPASRHHTAAPSNPVNIHQILYSCQRLNAKLAKNDTELTKRLTAAAGASITRPLQHGPGASSRAVFFVSPLGS